MCAIDPVTLTMLRAHLNTLKWDNMKTLQGVQPDNLRKLAPIKEPVLHRDAGHPRDRP